MAATTLFSAPISPHQYPISIQHLPTFASKNLPSSAAQSTTSLTRSSVIFFCASSSTPTVDKQEEDEEESSSAIPSDQYQPITSIPVGGCKACGKAEIERGCNGEGRIQGGIATVPGFGWWPIKAYRPCPGFVATGGRYRRQGQSMDEVAGFGTVPRTSPTSTTTPTSNGAGESESSSKKKEGRRKFKR